ncbi:hypothetical protein Syun_013273 [Stephania yunnanensis]|uniref:protein-serine/threonine phosphatase n=1 Tax=Stephania yunnanensis TaxID=152371 RepID=A0AAP0PGB4_9MAGN
MPIVAMIDGKVFCVHGGLSPDLKHLDQIRNICRPTDVPDHGLLCDLLWADPDPYANGWKKNDVRVSYTFGADEVKRFLSKHDLNLICRGNQIVENGYAFFADGLMATIFSAPNIHGKYGNAGAMMSIDETLKCSFRILNRDECSFQILNRDEKAMKLFHRKALRSECIDEALNRSFQILKPDEKEMKLDLHSKALRSGSRSPLQSRWRMVATAAALARRENVKVVSANMNVPRSIPWRARYSAPKSIRRRREDVKRETLPPGKGDVNSASQPDGRQMKDVKQETSPLRKGDRNNASQPLRRRREDVKREASPPCKGDSNCSSQLIRQQREGAKRETSSPLKGYYSIASQPISPRREDVKRETSPPRNGKSIPSTSDCPSNVRQRTSPPKVKSRPASQQAGVKEGSSFEGTTMATRPVTPVRFERRITSPLKGVFRWVTPTRVRRTSSPESVPRPATPTRSVSPFSMIGFLRSKSPCRVPQTPFRKEQKQ